ncbi:tagaturonate reductase [Amphibacillus marinus]|uniref:Tagaturonate reductase n=1 Tax=Amphibacillus marinus TaxID=872970 RepID=A0A1H8HBI1_9BACI|nr:tagaturonate reductase [Amphibacillus marinus]
MERLSKQIVDKNSYSEKVVQFGEGNFLRAFVDWQIDVMNKADLFNGSIVVVQPIEHGLTELLDQQDGLYTLILEGIKEGKAVREKEIINSISRTINPYQDKEAFFALAKQPELAFVFSNTTEAGIVFEETDIQTDRLPRTFPGKLTAFLYERYLHFHADMTKGLAIIPCELIDRNGDQLKACIEKYIDLWALPAAFLDWLNHANQFCCSLVDRIVPGYPRDQATKIEHELGYHDQLMVVAEHYHLWVIEGDAELAAKFPANQIGLNTLFVEDLAPYRTRKVHILNGSHTALTPIAYLMGLNTVEEAIKNEKISQFLKQMINEEVIPSLPYDQSDLKAYTETVLERFENPYLKHQLMSIALNSVSKFATRDLPILLRYYEKTGALPEKLVFALAALLYFYDGKRGNETIALNDDPEILERFQKWWKTYDGSLESAHYLVSHALRKTKWWGQDLTKLEGLVKQVAEHLMRIDTNGIALALDHILEVKDHA